MSTRRTALRRTLRLTLATSLVAAPATVVLAPVNAAALSRDVSETVSQARDALEAGTVPAAVRAALVSEPAAERPAAPASVIADKMVRPDVRASRAGSRIVPLVKKEPMRVDPRVVVAEKPTWVVPTTGYRLTGRFGSVSGLWSSSHTGLDFATATGTPIRSVADGVVKEAGYDGSYGYKTVVSLPDGGEVWYCHQDAVSVQVGQRLAAGEVLGHVGSTGNVTGPHLHLEIRHNDTPTDPATYLAQQGATP